MIPLILQSIESPQDRDFMEALYLQYNRLILSEVRKILKNDWDTEDVMQQVLIRLIGHIPKLQAMDRTHTVNYIIVTARNTAYNFLRDNKRIAEFPFDEAFDVADETLVSADERLILLEEIETAGAAWRLLDERSRRLLEMKYILEMPNEEIAQEIGVGTSSVRMLLTRARDKLKAAIIELSFSQSS